MASNASRGAAAKSRTKRWLMAKGYQVADLEVVRWIWTPRGRLPVKRDQFGSDLLAVNAFDVVFVQVKSGASAVGGTFPAARRAFGEFTFPPGVVRAIIAWAPRARAPRVVLVKPPASPAEGSADGETKGISEEKAGTIYRPERLTHERQRTAGHGGGGGAQIPRAAVAGAAGHVAGTKRAAR